MTDKDPWNVFFLRPLDFFVFVHRYQFIDVPLLQPIILKNIYSIFVYNSKFLHVFSIMILIYLLLNTMRLLNLLLIYNTRYPLEVGKRSGPIFSPTNIGRSRIVCVILACLPSTVNLAQNDPMANASIVTYYFFFIFKCSFIHIMLLEHF